MRRLLVLVAFALAASACGGNAGGVSPETVDVAGDPTTESVPAGRVALAAAQGSPHVLWFWGAH